MAFFGLFGGGDAKTDRSKQLSAWQGLQDLFSVSTSFGQKQGAKGTRNQDAAGGYWNTLLSGNRGELSKAVGPEAASARSTADASKKQMAEMGTSRTGGGTAQAQTIDDNLRAQINSLMFSIRPEAAKQLGQIGEQQIAQMLQSLGIGAGAMGTMGSEAGAAREHDLARSGMLGSALGKVLPSVLSMIFGPASGAIGAAGGVMGDFGSTNPTSTEENPYATRNA